MIDAATRMILLDVFQREGRSLLHYVSEAFPRNTAEEQDTLGEFLKMVKEGEQAAARLARFLQKHHVAIPPLGAYPISFTTINFVSLDYIVPLLIAHEKRRSEEIQAQLGRVSNPEARALVQAIIDLKKRHAQMLEDIRSRMACAA